MPRIAAALGRNAYRLPAARRQVQCQCVLARYRPGIDPERAWITGKSRTLAVAVDSRVVRPARVQETQADLQDTRFLVGDGPEIPVLAVSILARDGYVVA